jgi:hypothetical protein
LLPASDDWFCVELDSPPVESVPLLVVVDELSPDDVLDELSPEVVFEVVDEVEVSDVVPVVVVFAASAVCETPMVSAAVRATPAAAVPPPARAARRTSRRGLLFSFMPFTIGLSASAPPHANVKAFLSSPGTG